MVYHDYKEASVISGANMDVTREELDATEAELLEQVSLLDYTDKIKNRAYNLIRRRFRLERTILWIKQKIERDKR